MLIPSHPARIPRWRTIWPGALAGLVLACGGPPPGVRDLTIDDPGTYYEREGFVRLTPPTYLPSSSPSQEQVEIWLKLPDEATIALHRDAAGRPTLEFPPGARADRVEFFGEGAQRRIADIRGAQVDQDGTQTFFVYRPSAPSPTASLFGVAWAGEDRAVHAAATERLVAKLAEVLPASAMPPPRREQFLKGVRAKNRCADCHTLARPDNASRNEHGLVNRGTDRSGWFTPQTVLWDEVLLEQYGGHDGSLRDPSIEIRCGDATVAAEALEDRRCPDGSLPRGRFRWDRAWEANPERAQAICASRRVLVNATSSDEKAMLNTAIAPCRNR